MKSRTRLSYRRNQKLRLKYDCSIMNFNELKDGGSFIMKSDVIPKKLINQTETGKEQEPREGTGWMLLASLKRLLA